MNSGQKEIHTYAQTNGLLRVYGETDFITGLRAIAATMVVIVHTGAFVDFGEIGTAITNAGKYGVEIFFVISGFTIAKTFTEATDYKSYLARRIMRILPLYWLVISVAMLMWGSGAFSLPYWIEKFGSKPDIYNLALHLSMLSYFDYRVANSVLGVEWSIPIEVFWYVFLPPLIYCGKTIPRTIWITFFSSYHYGSFFLFFQTGFWNSTTNQMVADSLWPPLFPWGHLVLSSCSNKCWDV